jgi:hypothetical protein
VQRFGKSLVTSLTELHLIGVLGKMQEGWMLKAVCSE